MKVAFYSAFKGDQLTGGPQVALAFIQHLPSPPFEKFVMARMEGEATRLAKQLGLRTVVLGGLARYSKSLHATPPFGRLVAVPILFELMVSALRVHRVLRRERPAVLWVRNTKALIPLGAGAWLSGTPVVWDIGMEKPSVGIVKWLHRAGFWLASRIVVEGANVFRDVFPEELTNRYRSKLRVIPSGIEPSKVERLKKCIRRSDGRQEFVILNSGSICRRKNQAMLLEAIEPLLAEFPHVSVVLAGGVAEPPYEQHLRSRFADILAAGRVQLLGWRDDVPELMGSAHLLVHVAQNEGVPRVILEALHSELPILATSVGGVPDVITDGESGMLVSPNDVAALKMRLRDAIEHPERLTRLAENARDVVAERYTHERWLSDYEKLLFEFAK